MSKRLYIQINMMQMLLSLQLTPVMRQGKKMEKLEITHMMNQQEGIRKPRDFLNKKAR